MAEIRKQVRQIQVDYKCPKCETGYLRPTGQVYTTYPPMIPHKCNNFMCDYSETFTNKSYPYLDYEAIDTVQQMVLDSGDKDLKGYRETDELS